MLLDEHLTLAVCQPSGQGRQPGPSATHSWHAATTISVTLHPRKHTECFPSFLCTSPTTVASGAPLHIGCLTLVGRGLSTALCATQEGCPSHPSTSSPEAGSYRAPTYLSQHSPGDIHHFPSVLLQDSTTSGSRQIPQGSAAEGPSIPFPSQVGLLAHISHCLLLPQATSGLQLQEKAPGSVCPLSHLFSPSSSARTHRNHVCLTIYKTPPSCCFTMGAGQCPAGPRPPHWAQLGGGACHLVPGSCQGWQEQV